jgi:hypothetical protein
MDASKGQLVVAAVTSVGSCLASAAITTVVAIADPAETSEALFASVVVAAMGLSRARQIAIPRDEHEYEDDDDEPSVAQDPTQRRIDEVLEMVRMKRITGDEGERLIASLRTNQLPTDPPVYGTRDAS